MMVLWRKLVGLIAPFVNDGYEDVSRYYYWTTELGATNTRAALGNPMKGLVGSPRFDSTPAESIPDSMEYYYVRFNEVVVDRGNTTDSITVDGNNVVYDWTSVEEILTGAASRNKHAVLVTVIHYPGRPLHLPDYLLDTVAIHNYTTDEGTIDQTPHYGDPVLVQAMLQYIEAFGERYDGDPRIFCINAGLLGFWGEWHTHDRGEHVPEESKESIVAAYANAFTQTHIQTRYPTESAYNAGMGLHDGSFAYHTLSKVINWYFWPSVVRAGHEDVWRTAPIGAETRPEIQNVTFRSDVPIVDARKRQDFKECVKTTHATYVFHHDAFSKDGYSGDELENALEAHALMGYNFRVLRVAVAGAPDDAVVAVHVTIQQVGVAPFYYPLMLQLECAGETRTRDGVERIIGPGERETFSFRGMPHTATCLEDMTLSLQSPYAYKDRPIKFAQEGDDGTVSFSLPLSGTVARPPTPAPTPFPTAAPTVSPSTAPSTAPSIAPSLAPTAEPTSILSELSRVELYSIGAGLIVTFLAITVGAIYLMRRCRKRRSLDKRLTGSKQTEVDDETEEGTRNTLAGHGELRSGGNKLSDDEEVGSRNQTAPAAKQKVAKSGTPPIIASSVATGSSPVNSASPAEMNLVYAPAVDAPAVEKNEERGSNDKITQLATSCRGVEQPQYALFSALPSSAAEI